MRLTYLSGPCGGVTLDCLGGQQRRSFTSIVQRLGTAVERRVRAVADTHMMPLTKQSITERRRPYPRRPSMPENLSERLGLQRRLRARLVPAEVIVSRDRQCVELVWPAAALRAAGDLAAAPGAHTQAQHRTRLLAEFLRAYSPSTDVIGSDALIYGRRGITITDVFPVGNYALRIVFSDGHSGGVYPYEYLFHLGMHKYAMMREYIRRLKDKRKSRDPPRRAPSQRLHTRRMASTHAASENKEKK